MQEERHKKEKELLKSECARFHQHAAEELAKVEEKIANQESEHARSMQEIQEQLGKHVHQEAEDDAKGDAVEGKLAMTHFQEDPTLADLTPQQAIAALLSVQALMAKKLERKHEQEKEKEKAEMHADSSEDDDEEELHPLEKEEKKARRKAARIRAAKAGMGNVPNTTKRQPPTKRDTADQEPVGQARRKQDTSIIPGDDAEEPKDA